MRTQSLPKAALLLSSLFAHGAVTQTFAPYTDPSTGISFYQASFPDGTSKGGFQWGIALPADETGDNTEYIGRIVGSHTGGAGWSGITHGSGMPSALLLIAWSDGSVVRTSFRYAAGYTNPDLYTGKATLTEISRSVNTTHFTLTYRCQGCWSWNQNGAAGNQLPVASARSVLTLGFVQATKNPNPVTSSSGTITQHDNGKGVFNVPIASLRQASYSKWIAPVASTTTSATPTASATGCVGAAAPTETYDYIIAGAGAGGIPLADKLSEGGKSVLLIEKGPPSSGRWGGTMKPAWLEGTNLTRFDVPGLCNQIWVDSDGVACTEIDQMAGCVLGGGTAVNAALWWRAPDADWDYNFPAGWKAKDIKPAVDRVFDRIPWTDHPSTDGKLYKQEGYNVIGSALAAAGWKELTTGANNFPNEKNRTFAHTPFMYRYGERNGPLATYLVTASKRKNFKLITNTSVRRVIRKAGQITGVELEKGGCGVVNVTPRTGRVVLSAGVFNTAKILFRSGIGPKDQLDVVAGSSDGPTMIASSDWINLPVGYNLVDHVGTDIVVRHPNVSFYDFYDAWRNPIQADKDAYLNNRTGIFTMSAPNIGPMFWEVIPGSINGDGIDRALQWQARVESAMGVKDETQTSMTITQYLGRGSTTRGRLTITGGLTMAVTDPPYLKTKGDLIAVTQGLTNVLEILGKFPGIELESPVAGVSAADYLAGIPTTSSARRANHWMGSCKIGTDSGLKANGTAVVDTNTKVYGTNNLFVVDASLFPGEPTTNPSALIVAMAEHAAKKLLALR